MNEIDPKKLYANAPLVLGKLANISQAILQSWADAPPKVKHLAKDAVDLIARLAIDRVPEDECVIVLEPRRKTKNNRQAQEASHAKRQL